MWFNLNTNLKVLGLVQNMSHYVCPKCQHKAYLFGHDGAKDVAKEMDLELLGTVMSTLHDRFINQV